MKKDWGRRITQLEDQSKFLYGRERFEKWLQTNYPNYEGDLWELQDLAPEEFRAECLFWILEEIRADHNVPSEKQLG